MVIIVNTYFIIINYDHCSLMIHTSAIALGFIDT